MHFRLCKRPGAAHPGCPGLHTARAASELRRSLTCEAPGAGAAANVGGGATFAASAKATSLPAARPGREIQCTL